MAPCLFMSKSFKPLCHFPHVKSSTYHTNYFIFAETHPFANQQQQQIIMYLGWGKKAATTTSPPSNQDSTPPQAPQSSSSTKPASRTSQDWTIVNSPTQGSQFGLQRFVPSRLKVYSVDMGNRATKAVASALVGNSLLTTTLGSQLTQCATLTGAAQIESLGLVALRIPLRSLVSVTGGGTKLARFAAFVSEYAANNAQAVQSIAKMSKASQVMEIGAKGNIIGAIATAAVQQSIAIAYYVHGDMPASILKHQSVTIGISALGGVGGGTVGAAIGTLTFPGIGTALGSLLGSYTGAFVPFFVRGDGVSHQINEDPSAPSRKVKAVALPRTVSAVELDDDWLEVVDCTSESYFRLSDRRSRSGSGSSVDSADPNLPDNSAGAGTANAEQSMPVSSIRAFHQVLSAGYGATTTSVSSSTKRITAPPLSDASATFLPAPHPSKSRPPPLGDDDVIIYFQVDQGESC